jgi:hypothetical protein
MMGHHDCVGLHVDEPSRSWKASHPAVGCRAPELAEAGGTGLLYGFAGN